MKVLQAKVTDFMELKVFLHNPQISQICEMKLEKLITNRFGHVEGLSIEGFSTLLSLHCSLYSDRFANSFLGS
jgi:hypothetical protein